MIKVSCSSCGQGIGVADEHGGKKARCPKCKSVMEIPSKSTSEDEFFEGFGKLEPIVVPPDEAKPKSAAQRNSYWQDPPPSNPPIAPIPSRMSATRRTSEASGAPSYWGVKFIGMNLCLSGVFLVIVGAILASVGVFAPSTAAAAVGEAEARWAARLFWIVGGISCALWGCFFVGVGQLFYCIRDMARNSFR